MWWVTGCVRGTSPLHQWRDLILSICCHRPHHRYYRPAAQAPKENEANSLLRNTGKPSKFVQNPWSAPPTWPVDGSSAEQEQVTCSVTIKQNVFFFWLIYWLMVESWEYVAWCDTHWVIVEKVWIPLVRLWILNKWGKIKSRDHVKEATQKTQKICKISFMLYFCCT